MPKNPGNPKTNPDDSEFSSSSWDNLAEALSLESQEGQDSPTQKELNRLAKITNRVPDDKEVIKLNLALCYDKYEEWKDAYEHGGIPQPKTEEHFNQAKRRLQEAMYLYEPSFAKIDRNAQRRRAKAAYKASMARKEGTHGETGRYLKLAKVQQANSEDTKRKRNTATLNLISKLPNISDDVKQSEIYQTYQLYKGEWVDKDSNPAVPNQPISPQTKGKKPDVNPSSHQQVAPEPKPEPKSEPKPEPDNKSSNIHTKNESIDLPQEVHVMNEDESRKIFEQTTKIERTPEMDEILSRYVYSLYLYRLDDVKLYGKDHPGDWDTYLKKHLPEEYERRSELCNNEWLQPKYSLGELDGAEIYLSHIVNYGRHKYTVAYVKTPEDDEYQRRVFYRSGSSALWRFIPTYGKNQPNFIPESGTFEKWLSKSDTGEDSINAPLAIQNAIEQANKLEAKQSKPNDNEPSLYGALQTAIDPSLFKKEGSYGDLSQYLDFYSFKNVYGRQELTPGTIREGGRRELPDPETLTVTHTLSPNFDRGPLYSWDIDDSPVYGKLNAYYYASNNGALGYLFLQEAENQKRAWIAAIEVAANEKGKTPISALGLKSAFIKPGCLTTPLYEYDEQTKRLGGGLWGDTNDRPSGNPQYAGIWNYLSRIPIIQDFLKHHPAQETQPSRSPNDEKQPLKKDPLADLFGL